MLEISTDFESVSGSQHIDRQCSLPTLGVIQQSFARDLNARNLVVARADTFTQQIDLEAFGLQQRNSFAQRYALIPTTLP